MGKLVSMACIQCSLRVTREVRSWAWRFWCNLCALCTCHKLNREACVKLLPRWRVNASWNKMLLLSCCQGREDFIWKIGLHSVSVIVEKWSCWNRRFVVRILFGIWPLLSFCQVENVDPCQNNVLSSSFSFEFFFKIKFVGSWKEIK